MVGSRRLVSFVAAGSVVAAAFVGTPAGAVSAGAMSSASPGTRIAVQGDTKPPARTPEPLEDILAKRKKNGVATQESALPGDQVSPKSALGAADAAPVTLSMSVQSIADGQSAAGVLQAALGSQASVTSAASFGSTSGSSVFGSNPLAGVYMSSGALFSSGSAHSAPGPNDSPSVSGDMGQPGDSDLTAEAGVTTYDAAGVTGTIVPTGSSLHLSVVFGSDEYTEYVGQFNDIGAIFVNGTNCATLPGSSTPLSVNEVNPWNNANYYRSNEGFSYIPLQADGLTKPVTCNASVAAGQPVTIKIGVADALDHALDSWLWVGSSSLTLSGPSRSETGSAPNPSQNAARGPGATPNCEQPVNCSSGDFWHTFTDVSIPGRGVPLALERTYSTSGAATDGVFGYGWRSNLQMRLDTEADGTTKTVVQENGSTASFQLVDGVYWAPGRTTADLVANGDGTFTFTRYPERVAFKFNVDGTLSTISEPHGYTTTMRYDSGQLIQVTDSAGRWLTFDWGGGRITKAIVGPLDRRWTYTYDGSGNLAKTVDPAGSQWTFTYDGNHRMLTMTDPRGGKTTNTYDNANRVTAQKQPTGRTATWEFTGDPSTTDGGATVFTSVNGLKHRMVFKEMLMVESTMGYGTATPATTLYEFDPLTNGVTKVTDPAGRVTLSAYDSAGNLLSTTDPSGATRQWTYDPTTWKVTTETKPTGLQTTYQYNSLGDLFDVWFPGGAHSHYTYDSDHPGDLTRIERSGVVDEFTRDTYGYPETETVHPSSDPTATIPRTAVRHNVYGELVCQADGNAVKAGHLCPTIDTVTNDLTGKPGLDGLTWYDLDDAGRPIRSTDALGRTTTVTYDASNNVTTSIDPKGHTTATEYDADNRVVKVTTAAGTPSAVIETSGWDIPAGTQPCPNTVSGLVFCNVTTDESGNNMVTGYGALGYPGWQQQLGGRSVTLSNDLTGLVVARTDNLGRRTTLDHDAAGRTTAINYDDPSTPDVTFAYNADGARTTMTDGQGTTSYGYTYGFLTEVTGPAGTVTGTYNGLDQITGITYPGGQTVSRGYDSAGRLTSVADWQGRETTFEYDASDNLTATNYPNGVTVKATSNAAGAVTKIDAAVVGTVSYTRDTTDLITAETGTGTLGSAGQAYAYNPLNRLTANNSTSYAYSPNASITTLGTATFTYNSQQQLTSSTQNSAVTSYAYDQLGNRTTVTTAPTGTDWKYTYDQAGHLTAATSLFAAAAQGAQTLNGEAADPKPVAATDASSAAPAAARSDALHLSAAYSPLGIASAAAAHAQTKVYAAAVVKARPVLVSVNPAVVRVKTKPRVTITGSHLAGQKKIKITVGGAKATKVKVVSDSAVTMQLPSRKKPGTVAVKMKTAAGTSNTILITYTKAPVVWNVTPTSATTGQPATLTVTGDGFKGATAVKIGSTTATSVTVKSARQVIATIPANMASGIHHVTVTGKTGTSPTWVGDQITMNAPAAVNTPAQPAPDPTQPTPTPTPTNPPPVTKTANSRTTYNYDGDGLRVSTNNVDTGDVTKDVWDPFTGTTTPLTHGNLIFITGPDGLPIEQVNVGADGNGDTAHWFIRDQLGSTRALLDTSGTPVSTWSYTAYGTIATHTGTIDTPILYAGYLTDTRTGMYYLINRWYDPETGQFTTIDPMVQHTLRPYGYAEGEPLGLTDPLGMFTEGGCVSVNLGWIGGGTVEVCPIVWAIDDQTGDLEIGGTATGGVGLQSPAASAGVVAQVSTARTIGQLGGPFGYAGGSVELGPGITGNVFGGPSCGAPGNIVVGAEGGISFGTSPEAHGGISYTKTATYLHVNPRALWKKVSSWF